MSTAFEIPEWLLTASPPAPPADDHRIEGMVNHFIAGKQEALFTAPDAFYRLEGADAIQGQPAIADRLQALRAATLELARDDSERTALGPRLDLHIDDAADGIDRHVAEQRRMYQRQVVSRRQALIQRAAELEHDNDDKIMGLAEANATAAREGARMDGIAPDSPEEAATIAGARSDILRRVIDERIANSKGERALALFDQVKDQLSPADRRALDTPVQATRLDQVADQWIARETKTDGPPLQERLDANPDLPSDAKPIVRVKLDARESADESARVAKVQALDDELHEASGTQIFNPNAYRPGTFARLADAYEALGEPKRAEFARRMAEQDAFILTFTQLSSEKQQQTIEGLAKGDLRDSAITVQAGQAQAFDHDAFGAGTTLYKEVGPPVPIADVEGRIRQARQIAQLRGGITVVPFTVREIDDMRRTLANGSEQDKKAVLDRLAAIPADMRPSIAPQDEAAPAGSTHWFGITAAPSVLPQPTESADGASATSPAGGQAGSPAIEPAPGSPEYQAAEAQVREVTAAPSVLPQPADTADEASATSPPGNQLGSPATEPAPGSPEYQAAAAQARELDKPSYDDLSAWQRFDIEVKRLLLEGESKGATFRAESAARHLQTSEELRKRGQTEELGVYEKKFLLKNRNATTDLAAAVGQLVDAQRKLNGLPSSDALRQLFEAKSVGEAARLLDEKGGKIASAIGLGSLPTLTMGIVATAALGPIGGGIALTGSAGLDGYAKGLIGALSLRGIDINNPDALAAALQNKSLMDDVRKEATTDVAIEAGISSLAGMIGGLRLRSARRSGSRRPSKAREAEANGKGTDLEREVAARFLKNMKYDFAQQVEITTPSGVTVRMDFVVRDRATGRMFLLDPKDVQTLRIKQPNQRLAYLELAEKGGVITRMGWRSLPSRGQFPIGTKIPATKVQIQTRNGAYHVEGSPGSKRLSLVPWKDPSGRLDDI